MIDWSRYKNFSRHEFDSPDLEGSGDCMQQETINKLQAARTVYKRPIKISSGYRTKEHNDYIGGATSSAHVKGHAVDISCKIPSDRFRLILSLLQAGFTRLGIYDGHIHADDDPTKSPGVVWVGKSK